MEYSYKVLDEVYHWMLSKQKNIEIRLLNEKSEKIKTGDYITFNNIDYEGKYIRVKVINKMIFDRIENLLEKYDINQIMPNHTLGDMNKSLIKIYGEEYRKEKIVAIEFEYVSSDKD